MVIKNLVYLSYGNESEYRRAIFSILSFLTWCPEFINAVRINVYTDAPDFFKTYLIDKKIEYHLLTAQQLDEMSGQDNFLHRIKVSVIDLTFKRYPDEDVLFIDSDTFFISKADVLLRKLEVAESFMHVREYQVEEAITTFSNFDQGHFPKALIKYITESNFKIGDHILRFTPDHYSWNSGVLGLSSRFGSYMPDILKLTDQLYANTRWFLCEQLAFSFVLQRLTKIHPAYNFVCHYWGKRQKKMLDGLLLKYFNTNEGCVKDYSQIRSITISWKKKIENDLILEQIEIAKATGSWLYAGKKIIRFILANRLKISSYNELIKTFSNT